MSTLGIIVFNLQKGHLLVNQKTTGKYWHGFCDCVMYACKMSGSEFLFFFFNVDFSNRQEMKVS